MKNFTRILALLLCVVLLAFAFASCGKDKNKDASATTTAAKTGDSSAKSTTTATPATTTVNVWPSIAEEIDEFESVNKNFKIVLDMYTSSERIAKNQQYIQGPDEIEEGVTSAIEQLVYERNRDAKELLDVTVDYDYWNDKDLHKWGQQSKQIIQVVQGHAVDAPDLFVAMVYDMNLALLTQGVFKDFISAPGTYFNFESDGWMTSWMESLSFTLDRAYILGSDYFVDIVRAMGVLPFNKDLMDQNSAKLATAILPEGETLSDGETLSERFFDYVEMGNWTWDTLGKLCQAIWVDTDGNEQSSIGDTLGIITDKYSGMPAALMFFSTGEILTTTTPVEDGMGNDTGRVQINLPADSTVIGSIFDAVKSVFGGQGAFVTSDSTSSGNSIDQPGIAYHYTKFAENTLLFAGPCLISALESEQFQQMESVYSVVPLPKVSADKKYNTIIHNTSDAGAINVNANPQKVRTMSAYLQYCTERSPEIREEFLQIVMKYKNTVYDQGTDRMLNLIYANITNARDKAIEDAAEKTSSDRYHGAMKDHGFTWGSSDVVSWYEGVKSSKQSKVDTVISTWYTLPTSETAPADAE